MMKTWKEIRIQGIMLIYRSLTFRNTQRTRVLHLIPIPKYQTINIMSRSLSTKRKLMKINKSYHCYNWKTVAYIKEIGNEDAKMGLEFYYGLTGVGMKVSFRIINLMVKEH